RLAPQYGTHTCREREVMITRAALRDCSSVDRLRPQDSNLDLTAPKAVVLPLHQGGPRRKAPVKSARCCRVLSAARAVAHDRNNGGMPAHDEVDRIVDAWKRERPDLDFSPLQVLSRVGRLTRHLDRARRSAFASSGLESWEFDVLSALRREGEPYQLSPKDRKSVV